MDIKQAEQAERTSDVIQTLAEMHRGKFLIECGRRLQQLVDAVMDTGKKGKFSITLEVTPGPIAMGRATQLEITPKVKIDEPLPPQGVSIFFVGDDNRLTRNDPDQMAMFGDREEKNGTR